MENKWTNATWPEMEKEWMRRFPNIRHHPFTGPQMRRILGGETELVWDQSARAFVEVSLEEAREISKNREEVKKAAAIRKILVARMKREKADQTRKRKMLYWINRADEFLGDIMGEYASQEHGGQDGIRKMIEGEIELTTTEIKNCMFEALNMVIPNHHTAKDKLVGIVNFWYKRNYQS